MSWPCTIFCPCPIFTLEEAVTTDERPDPGNKKKKIIGLELKQETQEKRWFTLEKIKLAERGGK